MPPLSRSAGRGIPGSWRQSLPEATGAAQGREEATSPPCRHLTLQPRKGRLTFRSPSPGPSVLAALSSPFTHTFAPQTAHPASSFTTSFPHEPAPPDPAGLRPWPQVLLQLRDRRPGAGGRERAVTWKRRAGGSPTCGSVTLGLLLTRQS